MKTTKTRIISLLISALLIVAMLPAWCWAGEAVVLKGEQHSARQLAATSVPTYSTLSDAAKYVRQCMVKRAEDVSFDYKVKTDDIEGWIKKFDKDIVQQAVRHTGVPNEGEYLRWQYARCSRYNSIATKLDGVWTVHLKYHFAYYTTAEQEAELAAEINRVLASMDIGTKDDYAVISTVYDYVCKNISYDQAGLVKVLDQIKRGDANPDYGVFTAYNAMFRHKAVCQGFATLLYRMLNECGIKCRMIAADNGSNATEDGHAWNLVTIDGKNYYVDSTWDAKLIQKGEPYKHFLRGKNDFIDHAKFTRIHDYIKDVAVANSSYVKGDSVVVKGIRPTSISKLSAGKKYLKVAWKSRSAVVKGYQIQYATSSKFSRGKKTIVSNSETTSKKISKLKSGKKYYVRVRAYREVEGKKYYSSWSSAKSVKVK